MRAGYLVQRGDDWFVQPALTAREIGLPGDEAFLKIKEHNISGHDLPGLIRLDDPRYRPQIHPVRFDVETRRSQRGDYPAVTRLAAAKGSSLRYQGHLVCSGNMKEASKGREQRSPRKSHALVLLPNERARTLKVRPQAIQDYLAGLTDYQMEMLTDWSGKYSAKLGCLGDLKPVFYVAEGNEVIRFRPLAQFPHPGAALRRSPRGHAARLRSRRAA